MLEPVAASICGTLTGTCATPLFETVSDLRKVEIMHLSPQPVKLWQPPQFSLFSFPLWAMQPL